MTPKTSDSPEAIRNKNIAVVRRPMNWLNRNEPATAATRYDRGCRTPVRLRTYRAARDHRYGDCYLESSWPTRSGHLPWTASSGKVGVAHRSCRVEAGAARHRAERGCGLDPTWPMAGLLATRPAQSTDRPKSGTISIQSTRPMALLSKAKGGRRSPGHAR